MAFHDDPVVDRLLTSVNDALSEYRSAHERFTAGADDVNFTKWSGALVANDYEGEELDAAGEWMDAASAEDLAGFIPVLSELLTAAKSALRGHYYAKHDRADAALDVDLEAMRKKAKNTYDTTVAMAELGTFPGLTVDLIRELPSVTFGTRKVKGSTTLTNEILDLPRAPSKDKKAWTGVRSTNSKLRIVIDGVVPTNHPEHFGDALKLYGLGSVTTASPLFNDYRDRNKAVIFERDGKTYGLTTKPTIS